MDNLYFFPTVTEEMIRESGLSIEEYEFSYSYNNEELRLKSNGKTTIKLSDPLEIWDIESDGLTIDKTVRIAYPDLLKGPDGVACRDADLGICIIWNNRKLVQTGYILPQEENLTPQGFTCEFHHVFPPKTIINDLELNLILYIKHKADYVREDENNLINETGITVGELEKVALNFKSIYMDFPIEECCSEKEPLWWVDFSEWEDPKTVDMFSRDSFCLYLNSYYEACPAPSTSSKENGIKNFDLLVDILAQTYLLMFQRLNEDELKATKDDIGLVSGSICSVLYQFIENCKYYEELHWESPQELLKSLLFDIRKMLQEESQ